MKKYAHWIVLIIGVVFCYLVPALGGLLIIVGLVMLFLNRKKKTISSSNNPVVFQVAGLFYRLDQVYPLLERKKNLIRLQAIDAYINIRPSVTPASSSQSLRTNMIKTQSWLLSAVLMLDMFRRNCAQPFGLSLRDPLRKYAYMVAIIKNLMV